MTCRMNRQNILLLGGGGREHALTRALSQSAVTKSLHCAPGNPGIAEIATIHRTDICDAEAVAKLCRHNEIDLVVIGPEAPLAAGVADLLRARGMDVFGPGRDGAMLESSKIFSKNFMRRHKIPTSSFDVCLTVDECRAALRKRTPPFVIKADGLAAGKGVFLPENESDAEEICRSLLEDRLLKDAGEKVVIEDFTPGRELTVFALTDGRAYRILPPSRDHKRVFEKDQGPNTGGMGAYAPVHLPAGLMERIEAEVLLPTLRGLAADGIDYRGVLYMGLMLTDSFEGTRISVVEYNVRFGDPEAQAVLPLIHGDLGRAVKACAAGAGQNDGIPDLQASGHALCVVLASGGYPGTFEKGFEIFGLEPNSATSNTYVYHSGTTRRGDDILTSGGRVLTVVGVGGTFTEAKQAAYRRISSISFENMHYRTDIGWSEG